MPNTRYPCYLNHRISLFVRFFKYFLLSYCLEKYLEKEIPAMPDCKSTVLSSILLVH